MGAAIPKLQSGDPIVDRIQTYLIGKLNFIFKNPVLDGLIKTSVVLAAGSNTINHGLGRRLQGWVIIRQRASATIYDTQDSNTNPAGTLVLVASGAVTVDLYLF